MDLRERLESIMNEILQAKLEIATTTATRDEGTETQAQVIFTLQSAVAALQLKHSQAEAQVESFTEDLVHLHRKTAEAEQTTAVIREKLGEVSVLHDRVGESKRAFEEKLSQVSQLMEEGPVAQLEGLAGRLSKAEQATTQQMQGVVGEVERLVRATEDDLRRECAGVEQRGGAVVREAVAALSGELSEGHRGLREEVQRALRQQQQGLQRELGEAREAVARLREEEVPRLLEEHVSAEVRRMSAAASKTLQRLEGQVGEVVGRLGELSEQCGRLEVCSPHSSSTVPPLFRSFFLSWPHNCPRSVAFRRLRKP